MLGVVASLFPLLFVSLVTSVVRASPLTARSYNVFESQVQNDTKIRFVRDSGVCETTPGVHQISGYIDVGTNMSIVRP
jgi:hypothetical protein